MTYFIILNWENFHICLRLGPSGLTPPYSQPDRKKTGFFTTALREATKKRLYLGQTSYFTNESEPGKDSSNQKSIMGLEPSALPYFQQILTHLRRGVQSNLPFSSEECSEQKNLSVRVMHDITDRSADRTLLPTDPLCTLTIPVLTDVVTADFHIHRLLGGCHDKKWRP